MAAKHMPLKPSHKLATKSVAAAALTAAVISAVIPLTTRWEGTDLIAKRDLIGTGHPLTYCHGQTVVDGAVRAGQRFTPAQCDALLVKSLPKYLNPLLACIKRPVPVKVMGAALDAAYNAGPLAVCASPFVRHINAGDLKGACNSLPGWYVYASGMKVRGLINRRLAEQKFCEEGIAEGLPKPVAKPWWQRFAQHLAVWRG